MVSRPKGRGPTRKLRWSEGSRKLAEIFVELNNKEDSRLVAVLSENLEVQTSRKYSIYKKQSAVQQQQGRKMRKHKESMSRDEELSVENIRKVFRCKITSISSASFLATISSRGCCVVLWTEPY